jgi:hypothetical protein
MQFLTNTRVLIIIVLIALQIFFSCKKDDNGNGKNKNLMQERGNTKKFSNDVVEFEFDFPDTVFINKPYNGKIKYKGVLDTITKQFNLEGESANSRYIIYSFIKTKSIDYDEEYLSKIAVDTIGAIDNNTILLSNIKFTKLGTYYLDGIINDNAIINLMKRDNDGDDVSRSITNEVRATLKVFVIDKR